MHVFKLIVLVAVATLTLSSCHTHKQVSNNNSNVNKPTPGATTTAAAAEQQLGAIVSATGGWTTLKGGGNIALSGGTSFSSAMQVRMVRDQVLYISLRPLLGIEAGRLIIRGDSLYVINKLQKQYIAEKVSLLTAGIPATVGMMQDMFLGRPFVMGEGSLNPARKSMVAIATNDKGYAVTPTKQPKEFTYAFGFDPQGKITSLDVALAQGGTAYSMAYNDVRRTVAGNIAHALQFATDVKGSNLKLKLSYDNLVWNETVDTSFNIPAGYKRIDGKALLSIFAQ